MAVLMWIGIGVGVLVGGYLMFMVAGTIVTALIGRAPKGVEFEVGLPSIVRENDAFELVVDIRNTLSRERRLRSVDLDTSLRKGFVIDSIEPMPRESSTTLGTCIHHYDLVIPANAATRIRFQCRGAVCGDFEGDVTVYVDSTSFRFLARSVRLLVRPEKVAA